MMHCGIVLVSINFNYVLIYVSSVPECELSIWAGVFFLVLIYCSKIKYATFSIHFIGYVFLILNFIKKMLNIFCHDL